MSSILQELSCLFACMGGACELSNSFSKSRDPYSRWSNKNNWGKAKRIVGVATLVFFAVGIVLSVLGVIISQPMAVAGFLSLFACAVSLFAFLILKTINHFAAKKPLPHELEATRNTFESEKTEIMQRFRDGMLLQIPVKIKNSANFQSQKHRLLYLVHEVHIGKNLTNIAIEGFEDRDIAAILGNSALNRKLENLIRAEYLDKTPVQRVMQRNSRIQEKYRTFGADDVRLYKIIDNPQISAVLEREFAKYKDEIAALQSSHKRSTRNR